jgi:redox-sensitive bicupin YhaK (pirin superfamily)
MAASRPARVRAIVQLVGGRETADGAGVRLRRIIGTAELDHLDPFLLLDEFKSDRPDEYIGGFPDHPHRGFETVTYMLAGAMRHRDHAGHQGDLGPGDVQWMTAGRGIIHSEMPRQTDGLLWGFQLWVNLPARDKMCAPRYQDIPAERIPTVSPAPGVRVRVIAGEAGGARGPVEGIVTRPLYLDVALAAGSRVAHPVPGDLNACVYVFEGDGTFGAAAGQAGLRLAAGQLGVLGAGDVVTAAAEGGPIRFLLLAARPLGEPVARYGPFVMNTRAEILQAIEDYQRGRLQA